MLPWPLCGKLQQEKTKSQKDFCIAYETNKKRKRNLMISKLMEDCGKSFCFTYSFLFLCTLRICWGMYFFSFQSFYVKFGFVSGKYLQVVNKNKTKTDWCVYLLLFSQATISSLKKFYITSCTINSWTG